MKKKTVVAVAAGILVVGMIPVALFASSQNTAQQPVDINGNGVSHHSSMRCEQYIEQAEVTDLHHYELLEAVISLPEEYRRVVYLHYYEGYTAPEISEILGVKVNTVYTHLARGKDLLRDALGGEV